MTSNNKITLGLILGAVALVAAVVGYSRHQSNTEWKASCQRVYLDGAMTPEISRALYESSACASWREDHFKDRLKSELDRLKSE